MHLLDHFAFEPLRPAGRGGHQPLGSGDFLFGRGEGRMTWRDLAGVHREERVLAAGWHTVMLGRTN